MDSVLAEAWGLTGLDGCLGGRPGLASLAMACLAAASSLAFASNSRLVGGKGGKSAMSVTGGSLCTMVPLDPLLVVEEIVLVNDRDDMVDCIEASDDAELRRPEGLGTVIVDVRRGGSAGDAWNDPVLDGRGGGPEASAAFWVLRRGRGGGASALGLGLGGIRGAASCAEVVMVTTGAVWLRPWDSAEGRPGGGGGGGFLRAASGVPTLLKFFCLFNAAIRSASVLNWGSSVSAMLSTLSSSRVNFLFFLFYPRSVFLLLWTPIIQSAQTDIYWTRWRIELRSSSCGSSRAWQGKTNGGVFELHAETRGRNRNEIRCCPSSADSMSDETKTHARREEGRMPEGLSMVL